MGVVDIEPDIGIEGFESAAGGFHFGFADLVYAEEHLALEVAVVNDVEVYDADGTDAGGGEVEEDGAAEAAGTDDKDFGGFEFLLGFEAESGDDDVAVVARELFFGEGG